MILEHFSFVQLQFGNLATIADSEILVSFKDPPYVIFKKLSEILQSFLSPLNIKPN